MAAGLSPHAARRRHPVVCLIGLSPLPVKGGLMVTIDFDLNRRLLAKLSIIHREIH
jgi:hypothetical protein